jgi:hypothetical protein
LVPAVVGKLHELSTNDQTVRDPRLGKVTAAVVFFPAHTADHGGRSSAEIKPELARLSDVGTMKSFHEFSELHTKRFGMPNAEVLLRILQQLKSESELGHLLSGPAAFELS